MRSTSVLVADADPLQRQLFDMLLGVDAFDVAIVASGAEALAHLREHTPDAVVLATDLRDVEATVICRKLKSVKRLARVPVVLVAPEPDAGDTLSEALRRAARQAGADLLLQRPLGDKNLRERIQRLANAPSVFDSGELPPLDGSLLSGPLQGSATMAQLGGQPASELGALRAEVARLRQENEALKARLAKVKDRNRTLQQELEEARKPRGLFGRRG
jgi:CheY-like chemotaxis protein